MAHTKGPWKLDIKTGHLDKICSYEGSIVRIGTITLHQGQEINEANARLIASAPELLEALKEIAHSTGKSYEIVEIAEQAIAKAEGKE